MEFFKKKSGLPAGARSAEAGQAAKLILVLAVVIFVAALITYLILRMAEKPANKNQVVENTPPQPVYEATLGDIRFVFESATDMGSTLYGSQSKNPSSQRDLTTTEKFIKVVVGAQNKGKINTPQGAWDIENIVDSDGRNFVPIQNTNASQWIKGENLCGALLKPEFDPFPCVKIYEVSKVSTGLKIRVVSGRNNTTGVSSNDRLQALIDLIVK